MSQSKTIWLFSVAIVATALIVGGIVYFGQQNMLNEKEEEAKAAKLRVSELETQLTEFQQAQTTTQNKLQVPPIQDWKTYSNEELSMDIMYPDTLFKIDAENNELYHQMQSFTLKSLEDGTTGELAKDMQISLSQDVDQNCEYLAKEMQESGVEFVFQNIKGIKYDSGAEGRGVVTYCIQDNKKKDIAIIRRFYINETYAAELAQQTDYINSQAQSQLFDLMLQTIKIKDYDISGLGYENETYGFTLKFPQIWTGYAAKEVEGDATKTGEISFNFAADDPLFTVSVFTKAQWNKAKDKDTNLETVIKEGAKYVFTYSSIETPATADKAKFDAIKDIIASFELK